MNRPLRALARSLSWVALAALLAAGCSSGSSDNPVITTIGPGGGSLSGQGATLTVPAGALAQTTSFTFAAGATLSSPAATVVGGSIVISPTSVAFALPVRVTLPYDPALIPAGRSPADLLILEDAASAPRVRVADSVDLGAQTVTFTTTGLSTFQPAIFQLPNPTPGGQVAALTSGAVTVGQTLHLGQFADFSALDSLSTLVIPEFAALADRAFLVEQSSGNVRVLNLSGAVPTLDRVIPLEAAPLPAGVAAGSLTIQGSTLALCASSGAGGEGVYLFDPSTATGSADVTEYDLNSVTVTWPAGTLNSVGTDVGGSPLSISFVSGVTVAGGRLYACSSNFDASFNLNPGTVVSYSIDLATRAISNEQIIRTTDFNPTGLTLLGTPQGEAVLCTNTGPFGTGPASIDVIDPQTNTLVGSIGLGAHNPQGRVVVSPDGRRGYVGSQATAEFFVIDLENLGQVLGGGTPQNLSGRFLGGYALPSSASFNFVSGLALSHTGNYLYAVNFNASNLWVVDLAAEHGAVQVVGFQRSGLPQNFEGNANAVAVRPGRPGIDYPGPSVFVTTLNLAAADQTVANVNVVLDGLSLDRH